jgi:RNA polymerase sigma-70 factor (TIGR02960 family)
MTPRSCGGRWLRPGEAGGLESACEDATVSGEPRRSGSEADVILERAKAGDEEAFRSLCEPYRSELRAHCYRIVGSVEDAEDLVQETLLAAWRGLGSFEGRATTRSWLYRIATNRALNALRDRGRRPREPAPSPEEGPEPPLPTRHVEPIWLQPYPDALLDAVADRSHEPDARYEAREAIELAFVAGLQRLPPLQRAVLVLRDVLAFRASEVAAMLDTTEGSVNAALRRARAAVERAVSAGGPERAPLPDSAEERQVVAQFTDAFERSDVELLVGLLTDDALLTMPPQPFEFEGRAAIGRFFSTVPAGGALDRILLVPTRANGQPAFACYLRDAQTPIAHAYGVMVLTLRGDRISAITGFVDTSLFPRFGLPRTYRG